MAWAQADRKDGKPIASGEGPYRLIVPDDKRPARWVKQVRRITVACGARSKRASRSRLLGEMPRISAA
jgi:hypothetical protein